MKLAWILFGSVLSMLMAYAVWHDKTIVNENIASNNPQTYSQSLSNGGFENEQPTILKKISNKLSRKKLSHVPEAILPDSIVAFGLSHIGDPYLPAGITCKGFDCSGYVVYIFEKYGVELPHSSSMLAKEGTSVPLNKVNKGDLLIFTGTNVNDRTPGHVGVVITNNGEPTKFIHSSSARKEPGVKISEVVGTLYEKRFLEARRVL